MHIDLLLIERCGFTYENYTAQKIGSVLEKKNISYRNIFFCDGILQEYMHSMQGNTSARMVSFAPLVFYETPFCDLVRVPQLLWVKNSLADTVHFISSQYGKICFPTKIELTNTMHLPHGVEPMTRKEPAFDVVFFSSLVDMQCLEQRWKEFFSEEEIHCIKQVTNIEAMAKKTRHPQMIKAVEEYLRAQRAHTIISSYKERSLDLFGEHIGNNWYTRLCPGIRLHAPLPYIEHFEVLAQSKLVILDPLDRDWQLPAAAAGCLPLMADQEDLYEQIALFLADPKKREEALERYQGSICSQTWEQQTEQLIEYLYES